MPPRKSHANGDSSLGAEERLFTKHSSAQEHSEEPGSFKDFCTHRSRCVWCPLLPSVTEEKARVGKKSVDKFSRRTRTAQPPSLPRKEATLWDNEHPQNYLHAPPTFFHPNCISATFHFCRAAHSRHRLHFHSILGRSKHRVLFGRQKRTRPSLKRTACSSLATGSNTRPSHSRGRFGKTSVA